MSPTGLPSDRRLPPWQRAHPTSMGWLYMILVGAVAVAALNTGNNLLYLVVGLLCAILLVNNVVGEWNLRNLRAIRQSGHELFAQREGWLSCILVNQRRWVPAFSIEIAEADPTGPSTRVAVLSQRSERTIRYRLTPRARGWRHFTGIRLTSTFPFGIVARRRDLDLPGRTMVYPALGGTGNVGEASFTGNSLQDDHHVGSTGDFIGLREYQEGDPLRQVHWPTTARLGTPMIVVRGDERDEDLVVRLDDRTEGERWENEIRAACRQVVAGFRAGRAVGLETGTLSLPPRKDPEWRHHILATLALLPTRERGPADASEDLP